MFKTSLVDEKGQPVTIKSGDRVRFEKSPTSVLISIFPKNSCKTYYFGSGPMKDDKHMIACTFPEDGFDTFCEANMAFISSLAGTFGFKRVRTQGDLAPHVRIYEVR